MGWFWCFALYSLAGFGLEELFGWLTGGRMDRKCLRVLPLCPVYGLGACGILLLPGWVTARPLLLFLLGGLTATAVEYCMALWYEEGLGVSFWDYRGLPGSVQGRVCLPFSLVWSVLALGLVYGVHPWLSPWLEAIPGPVSWCALAAVAADILLSGVLLRRTGDRDALRWRSRSA
ncbi:MAG: putative ABC transporter permease [Lawsonibacter sp.]|nr:putative ABC transporter permease [Lawsonibacter sp.]